MDTEGLIRWALNDTRTIEERYTMELLVEQGVSWWNSQHKIYKHESIDAMIERKRQRALNPAYEPHYTEQSLQRAAEMFPQFKSWFASVGHDERPVRDIAALRFFLNLESVHLNGVEVADLSALAELPRLRSLRLSTSKCEDYRPLARCTQLRELQLTFWRTYFKPTTLWPDLTGLEQLRQLEVLTLEGNLLAFERGVAWPNVRRGTLKCEPLAARNVRDLPQLPACEFLALAGVERFEGIEALPRLRNLNIESVVRDFAPLENLRELTCFTCQEFEPLDVSPLARVPKLHFISFDTRYKNRLIPVKPRDFSPLAEAPLLRELHVKGCPPVEAEVATLNALLPPWDDVLLAASPRPLPAALRMIVAKDHPRRPEVRLGPDDSDLADDGLRECESRWVGRFVTRAVNDKLGQADWGTLSVCGKSRRVSTTIESFAAVEKFPLIIEALREALARLRYDYDADFMICLKAPRLEPTPAQVQLEEQFRDEQEKAEYERHKREQAEYLERLHRLELKKQAGEEIDPQEFVPPAATPLPLPPWERDEDEDDEDDDNWSGDVAVKEKPDPPPSWLDDEHPLADNYRLMGRLTLSEIWFMPHHRDLAGYLMGRPPDHEIPEAPA
ncbi:MAG: hypothetical protein HY043_15320 [Verrucomicrobia bacterium]|nr:hypothetical protein [Verrucomicrobiota bacterium]